MYEVCVTNCRTDLDGLDRAIALTDLMGQEVTDQRVHDLYQERDLTLMCLFYN